MAKRVKIWIAENTGVLGGKVMRRTVKGLCEATGISYSTGKRRLGKVSPGDKAVTIVSGEDDDLKMWMVSLVEVE